MNKLLGLSLLLLLAACDNNSNNNGAVPMDDPDPAPEPNAIYEVSVTNLTLGQPLSPLAVLIHSQPATVFSVGQPSSMALETLAESGDNSELLAAVDSAAEVSGSAPLGPGASETLMLELDGSDTSELLLSIVTMLVNTNDAITAVNGASIATLEVGESMAFDGVAYDAGTEANTEVAASIPGPAGGGEGFNALRDDVRDQVTMHGGVVSAADGLDSSDLGQEHRFDNPVARFSITRTQ